MIEYNFGVHYLKISEFFSGQRIDNFLKNYLKSVPESVIYRIIRTGDIRVNQQKVNFYYKLKIEDILKIPPIKQVKVRQISIYSKKDITFLKKSIIYEDNHILLLNKPAGIAVHDGSKLQFNIIDGLRNVMYSKIQFLELAHRLDRETSGILLFAKSRPALIYLQEQWRLKTIQKEYLALVCGIWDTNLTSVSIPVLKKKFFCYKQIDINLIDIKHQKFAHTYFQIKEYFNNLATLLIIKPITGRNHQIRTHTQYAQHPIIGDRIYGNNQINAKFKKLGLNRLFLHASRLCFNHPDTKKKMNIFAPIDRDFYNCLLFLRKFKK